MNCKDTGRRYDGTAIQKHRGEGKPTPTSFINKE